MAAMKDLHSGVSNHNFLNATHSGISEAPWFTKYQHEMDYWTGTVRSNVFIDTRSVNRFEIVDLQV